MAFLWPWALTILGVIPLLVAAYLWSLRRRRPAVRFSSLSLVRDSLPRQSKLRRHLPFVLFTLAIAGLGIALARPVRIISLPANQVTIILSLDVSMSMRQRDIRPSRLEAAERSAISFIQRQKAGTQIGVVAFSNFAEIIQQPTNDQEALQTAVESLTMGRRTAIGAGILKALDAIAQVDPNVAPIPNADNGATEPTPVPKGAYAPDIIVLLTDGVSNTGPLPLEAAQAAADRGVRVYTIGYGTDMGDPNAFGGGLGGQPNNNNNGGGGFFGGGGGGFRRGIDESTLKQIAGMTGGEYFAASSADELQEVFQSLPTYLITKHETTEISVLFVAAGAVLAALAVLLSMLWRPLP